MCTTTKNTGWNSKLNNLFGLLNPKQTEKNLLINSSAEIWSSLGWSTCPHTNIIQERAWRWVQLLHRVKSWKITIHFLKNLSRSLSVWKECCTPLDLISPKALSCGYANWCHFLFIACWSQEFGTLHWRVCMCKVLLEHQNNCLSVKMTSLWRDERHSARTWAFVCLTSCSRAQASNNCLYWERGGGAKAGVDMKICSFVVGTDAQVREDVINISLPLSKVEFGQLW